MEGSCNGAEAEKWLNSINMYSALRLIEPILSLTVFYYSYDSPTFLAGVNAKTFRTNGSRARVRQINTLPSLHLPYPASLFVFFATIYFTSWVMRYFSYLASPSSPSSSPWHGSVDTSTNTNSKSDIFSPFPNPIWYLCNTQY